MLRRKWFPLSFILAATLFGTTSAHASLVLSNLSEPDLCSGGFCFGTTTSFWGARSFSTDANSWVVDSIDVLATSPSVFVAIYSDVAGVPGAQIGNLPGLSGSDELGTYDRQTFTSSDGSIALDPSTDYWFVFGSSGAFNPQFQQTDNIDSAGPWTINLARTRTSDSGTSWSTPSDVADQTVKFEINATNSAIPEPTTFAVWSLLGLTVAGARRLRRTS